MGKRERLTPRQRRAIEALLSCHNVTDAATSAGVSRRTIERWMQGATFRDSLRQAQADVLDAAVRRLTQTTELATDTLQGAMLSILADWPVKIRAADIVLSRLFDLKQVHDFEQRLAALEKAQGGNGEHSS